MSDLIPGVYDFDIEAGATLDEFLELERPVYPLTDPVTYEPWDLTGYTGTARMRHKISDDEAYDIQVLVVLPNILHLRMEDEATALLPCGKKVTDHKSQYQWALKLTDASGDVVRLLEGTVRVSPDPAR